MARSPHEATSRLAAIPNPFMRDVVGTPLDDAKVDVPGINRAAFDQCVRLIERVASQRESGSLLLFGEPGSGKTHLLGRLWRYADRANLVGELNVFIPLRMQTGPSMIWRFVRAHLADALLRRRPVGPPVLERILEERRRELDTLHHRDLAVVLDNLLRGVHVRDSAAWLRGYELPEAALVALGLSTQPVDEEFQEDRAYQVIREIAELASPVPLVFCLDQVESLQHHAGDREGIFALGKLVSALHDTLRNAAIVCCVQTSFIDAITNALRGSEQDRMLANRAGVNPLTWEQGVDLICARMDMDPGLSDIRPAEAGRLWPLDAGRLRPVFEPDGTCAARRVLHRAREIYDQISLGGLALPEPLDALLTRRYEERYRIRPARESDFILRDALPRVLEALGLEPRAVGFPRTAGFDLVVEHAGQPTAFALCNQRTGIGLVNRFRRLGEKWDSQSAPRLVLLRDARLGIAANAKASQHRLEELRNRQAELVTVTPEALASLHALRTLLAEADTGDLAHNGETVGRKTVQEWIAAHIPPAVAGLIDQLAGQSKSTSNLVPALTAFLSERKIVSMEDGARELNVSLQEVADCAHQNPQQFGVLDGPRPVLFQPVREPAEP